MKKVRAVLARSTFASQNVQSTSVSTVFGSWQCSTLYDLASLFRGRRSTLDRWSGKIAKRIGTRPSALHSIFYVWRMSRRIALFLMLSTSKIEDSCRIASFLMLSSSKIEAVSQNLLRFWCCQVQKLRKSRRLASFSSLQIESERERERERDRLDRWMDGLIDRQVRLD